MTTDEKRIRIAEACGEHDKLPDYFNDLNAMHDAVSILDYEQADEFEGHLYGICVQANAEKDNPAPYRFAVVNATAAQRAEAFGLTLKLWEAGE